MGVCAAREIFLLDRLVVASGVLEQHRTGSESVKIDGVVAGAAFLQ